MHQRRNSNLLKVYIKTIVKTIFQPLSSALSMSQWMALIRESSHSTSKHLTTTQTKQHHIGQSKTWYCGYTYFLGPIDRRNIFAQDFHCLWDVQYPYLSNICLISIFEQCLPNIHIWAIFVQYPYLSDICPISIFEYPCKSKLWSRFSVSPNCVFKDSFVQTCWRPLCYIWIG